MRHYAATAGRHPLDRAGGNQRSQTGGRDGAQRGQHKSGHYDEEHRSAAHADGNRAIKQMLDTVSKQIRDHYAMHRAFTDVEIARHIGNSWNKNGLRHETDGDT